MLRLLCAILKQLITVMVVWSISLFGEREVNGIKLAIKIIKHMQFGLSRELFEM